MSRDYLSRRGSATAAKAGGRQPRGPKLDFAERVCTDVRTRQFCHDSVSTVVCAAMSRLEFGAKLQKLCSRALLQRPAAAFLFPWRGTSVAEKKLSIVTFVSVPIQKVASSLHLVLLLILRVKRDLTKKIFMS